jgi:hypothetical protein
MLVQLDGISKTDWSFIPRVMSLNVLKLNSDPEKKVVNSEGFQKQF